MNAGLGALREGTSDTDSCDDEMDGARCGGLFDRTAPDLFPDCPVQPVIIFLTAFATAPYVRL